MVPNSLEHDIFAALNHCLNWFKVNSLKAKPTIFQFTFLSRKKDFQCKCKIKGNFIFSRDKVILLGITIDNKITVETLLENLSKKPSYKLHAIRRIKNFPTVMQAQTIASPLQAASLTDVLQYRCSVIENCNINLKNIINKH